MTKNNDPEYFDGHAVTLYEGRFGGAFDLPEEVGENMRYDDVAVFLVTAVVGEAKVSATKHGDMKRSNKLDVVTVRAIDAKVQELVEKTLANQQTVPASTYVQNTFTGVAPEEEEDFQGYGDVDESY